MECTHCGHTKYVKNGFFTTKLRSVQRYKCKGCGKKFTDEDLEHKYEKRPDLTLPLNQIKNKDYTQREMAEILGCAKNTIQQRLRKNK